MEIFSSQVPLFRGKYQFTSPTLRKSGPHAPLPEKKRLSAPGGFISIHLLDAVFNTSHVLIARVKCPALMWQFLLQQGAKYSNRLLKNHFAINNFFHVLFYRSWFTAGGSPWNWARSGNSTLRQYQLDNASILQGGTMYTRPSSRWHWRNTDVVW